LIDSIVFAINEIEITINLNFPENEPHSRKSARANHGAWKDYSGILKIFTE